MLQEMYYSEPMLHQPEELNDAYLHRSDQIDITAALTGARAKAAAHREQARKARATAWADFEAAVYAAEDN